MRRRDFITLVGGVAAAWPLRAHAQKPVTVRRVAWLGIGTPGTASTYLEGLRTGLSESGWVEGRNLTLSLYWATGFEDMEGVARTLIASEPDAIVTQELMVYAVKPLNPKCPVIFGFSGARHRQTRRWPGTARRQLHRHELSCARSGRQAH